MLDPIIVPDDVSYLDSGTIDIPEYISDHKATYIIMPTKHQRNISYTRLVWLYKRADFESLKNKIDNFDWYCLLQGTLDEATELFTSVFLKFVKQCIPSKNVTIRGDDKPWYDSEIRSFTRKRDKQAVWPTLFLLNVSTALKGPHYYIFISRVALNQIYLSYVLPILEYSSIVWDSCTQNDSSTLEKLQHEAARIVTGLTRSVSLEKNFIKNVVGYPYQKDVNNTN